ncbi:MAG TPA: hypothetical protein VHB70_11110, partial [Parafilimonas sp.]|nr:hypothetical protein [Parafilimonas sp.]
MKRIILCSLIALLFSACVERAYYVSPGYGNAMPYHTLPLKKDSLKRSLYMNGSILAGGANDRTRDAQYALNANLYEANTFNWIRLWYGGGLTMGNYSVKPYDSIEVSAPFAAYINSVAGGKFFGSLNQNAGVAFAIPLGRRSEWRILGIQA